jgi:branched-chain amino acid transport system permease protein
MDLPCGTFKENYAQDMAIIHTRLQWLILVTFLAFLFTLPLYLGDRWLGIIIIMGISVITVQGLNILTGYCGQISLGQPAFMAVGAYTSALLCAKLSWPYWAALPCAAIAAGVVGIVFGLPSLKVKGFYLIMTTLAAQFIIIWIILQLRSLTGGVDGLAAAKPMIAGIALTSKQDWFYLIIIIVCLSTFFAKNLVRTRIGRAFIAIRDNDLAAEIMGVNLYFYKLQAFFIGCMFAGVAGSLLVHYVGVASPEQFTLMDSVWYLGMLIVGGMGTTIGAILGTVFIRLLDEFVLIISPVFASAFPAFAVQASASLGLITYSFVIILFLMFEPRGLAHRWQIAKKYFRNWPFSY